MKTTVTEKFDAQGRVVERVTVTEDDAEIHVSPPYWNYPTICPSVFPEEYYRQSPHIVTCTGDVC